MSQLHHVAEEVTEKDSCIRCSHSRGHHQHFRKGAECVGTEAIFVRGNVLSSLPCRCRKYSRGHLQVALAVVGTLVVIWAVSHGLAMVPMSASLFEKELGTHMTLTVTRWSANYRGMGGWVHSSELVQPCLRCGSLVLDRDQHTRWHRAVDTAETTEVGR